MAQAAQVLSYLSRLAPTPSRSGTAQRWTVVARAQDLVWVGSNDAVAVGDEAPRTLQTTRDLDRLVATDALQTERLLRVGWLWLAGTTQLYRNDAYDDRRTTICLPMFVRSVEFQGEGSSLEPVWLSDLELHPYLAEIPGAAEAMEPVAAFYRQHGSVVSNELAKSLRSVLAHVGLHEAQINHVEGNRYNPHNLKGHGKMSLQVGAGIYMDRSVKPSTAAQHLQRWASVDVADTAFAHVYGVASETVEMESLASTGTSPLPLNSQQRRAMRRVENEPVVTVAGPPGTGKSHAAVAIACEAIHRGQSVLVATKSDHAAQSISEILDRHETPPYVRFGNSQHRRNAVQRLTTELAQAPDRDERSARAAAAQEADAQHERTLHRVKTTLEREANFRKAQHFRTNNAGAAASAPGVLGPDPGYPPGRRPTGQGEQ